MKKYKFGDMVYVGLTEGVVVKAITKRKWTYYDIVFEDFQTMSNDWNDNGIIYDTYREDSLS